MTKSKLAPLFYSQLFFMQALQIINPEVTNREKSKFWVAVALGDLQRFGVQCSRSGLEAAVKNGHGMVNDSRYFLKQDVSLTVSPGSGDPVPKSFCRKSRCCSSDKSSINEDVLHRLLTGMIINLCTYMCMHF